MKIETKVLVDHIIRVDPHRLAAFLEEGWTLAVVVPEDTYVLTRRIYWWRRFFPFPVATARKGIPGTAIYRS